MLDVDDDTKGGSGLTDDTEATTMLKMTVGGITVDFASMIEEVVANNDQNTDIVEADKISPEATETQSSPEMFKTQSNTDTEVTETQTSPEAASQGLVPTPEAPEAE